MLGLASYAVVVTTPIASQVKGFEWIPRVFEHIKPHLKDLLKGD
jgi:hypothetical protein